MARANFNSTVSISWAALLFNHALGTLSPHTLLNQVRRTRESHGQLVCLTIYLDTVCRYTVCGHTVLIQKHDIIALMIKRCLDELLQDRSRYWLAQETGISEGNLGRLARQETSGIEFETLEKICRVLNCGPGDLLLLADDKRIARKRGHKKATRRRDRKKRRG